MNIQQMTKPVVERISKYLDTAFPIFFFLLANSFYLRTYDSAMVKITEVQVFGTILVALWICKVFESGHWPFSKNQTLITLPFLLIFASGVASFIFSPLHWGSFDFFVRRVIYIGIAMIAMTELTSLKDFKNITKWLIIAVAVCTIYGLIQWVDFYFFPPGPPTVGLDKFVWRRAFGQRMFSTFGNPNFFGNFLVIMVPILMAMYLKTRQFFLIPLLILTLANIYWTGSKGPAMGLIGGTGAFAFLMLSFFVKSRKIKAAVFSAAAAIILALGIYVYMRIFVQGSITSFTFRIYTWLSTVEMIDAKPVFGNGIGTFWVVYPAYRRPAIFHIEAKHNTETDHAENEHLEVWQDEGTVGMGFWIWMILMISVGIYKAMKVLMTSQPARAGPQKTEAPVPEEVYYMLGFFSGFFGMLVHNFSDVSMRFVSSGAPFWLLAGLNAALIMYSPLPEDQAAGFTSKNEPFVPPSPAREWAVRIFRYLLIGVIAIVAIRIIRQFDWCQMRDGIRNPNEIPHFLISWGVFLLCWGTAVWWFIKIALEAACFKSLVTILAATLIIIPFWGMFVGDVNHNRAIFFSKEGIWTRSQEYSDRINNYPPEYQMMYRGGERTALDRNTSVGKAVNFIFPDVFWRKDGIGGALDHYEEVKKLRPDFIMSHYFCGNVYNDWGSQIAQQTKEAFERGDVAQGEVQRKRTEEMWGKSMSAYDDTRKLGPNYVQMHHQVGTVHQKWGDFYNILAPLAERYGKRELAQEYRTLAVEQWKKALASYNLYNLIDPVYDQNYYRKAQLYIQLGEIDKAEKEYIENIQGTECKKPYHQIMGGFYYPDPKLGTPTNRYDLASPTHTHDITNPSRPEAWIYLGDFYSFVKVNNAKAEHAYKKAVELRPDRMEFLKRLATFYVRTGRGNESIPLWQKMYQIDPKDPDVQRVIQVQK